MTRVDKKTVFRRQALERLNDIDELDRLVTVTHARAWLTLGAVAALLIAALVWASVGKLAETISGDGILLAGGQTLRVSATENGRLTALVVELGERIKQGQPVAVVTSAQAETRLHTLRTTLARRQAELDHLRGTTGATATEIAAATRAAAAARQTVTRAAATQAQRGQVISPYSGVVRSLQATRGQYVTAGAPLVTVEPVLEPLIVVLYLPLEEGKKVRLGQDVQIMPAGVSEEEWGYLLGTVSFVAAMAATPESMQSMLQNDFLVQSFAAEGPVLRVEASLTTDVTNPSGYAWSTSSGPPGRISSGTTCNARIILGTSPPITYVFPALKRLLGGGD